MKTEQLTYSELLEAIEFSFTGDDNIYDFYDPSVVVNSLKNIVDNISEKIREYENAKYFGVYRWGELIGYFVFEKDYLISFAINIKYRNRRNLRVFFRLIVKKIGKNFTCYLWSRNIRAIIWLQKMGMQIQNEFVYINHLVTKLTYS